MNTADKEFMDHIIAVIHENIADESFGVERLAEILHMSRSSLLRKIKVLSGLSPNDFIRLIRLKKAAELIQTQQYSVQEVSEMVGFNDTATFRKRFTEQYGTTPSQYGQP